MEALTLFIPGLSRLEGPDLRDRAATYPRLARMLGRAHCLPREVSPEAALLQVLGLSADSAWARLTARIDLTPMDTAEDLLRCDPVYLHADPNKVLLYAAPHLAAAEADALLGSLNRDFPELGLRRGVHPGRWYLRRPAEIDGRAPSVHWLNGRSLSPHLPQAREHRSWRQLLNELQMALHDHPVNEARAARGLPPVNGVWICGGGVPASDGIVVDASPIARCFGNDVLLAGAAACRGIPWQARLPTPVTALQEMGRTLVILAGPGFGAVDESAGIAVEDIETVLLPAFPPGFGRRWRLHGAAECWSSAALAGLAFWRAAARFALESPPT